MDTIKLYMEYLGQQDRSQLTIKGYGHDLGHFVGWFEKTNGEDCTLTAITPTDIRSYRRFMLEDERRKASTVNRHLAALSSWMAWALRQGLIERNPTKNVRNVPQDTKAPQPYRKPTEMDECKAWLEDFLKSHPDGVQPKKVVEAGIREGFSRSMIYRAHDALLSHIANVKGRKSPGNHWVWSDVELAFDPDNDDE